MATEKDKSLFEAIKNKDKKTIAKIEQAMSKGKTVRII